MVVKKLHGFNHPVCMLNKNNVLDLGSQTGRGKNIKAALLTMAV